MKARSDSEGYDLVSAQQAMIPRLRNRVPRGSEKTILPVSRHPLGSGGTNVRLVVLYLLICLLSALLLFLVISNTGRKSSSSLQMQADELAKLVAEMRSDGMFGASTATDGKNKSLEAYATALYYDGVESDFYMYACAAASLGLALKQIDPERPRVALVTGLTEDARRILTDGDIWELVEVPAWPMGQIGGLKPSFVYERKAALWDLTSYKRVLYFDSDAFILPDKSGQRLKRLETMWQLEALGKWHPYFFLNEPKAAKAYPFPNYPCVHGSHVLLEPSSDVSAWYRAMLQDPPNPAFSACGGKDQKALSYVFPHCSALRKDLWRIFRYGGKGGNATACDIVLEEEVPVDELHFFFYQFKEVRVEKFSLQQFWGGDCTSCILNGKTCKYPNSLTQPCQKKIVELWWERIMQLPSSTANMCMHHLGANLNNVDEACYNK